jgi:hypothetical protein
LHVEVLSKEISSNGRCVSFPFKGYKTTGHHQLECYIHTHTHTHTHTHEAYPQNKFCLQILPLQCCRFRKLCSRWVPKMLTEEHKMKWQASVLTFLIRYSELGDDFLSHTVTVDETWVSHVTPESKQHSMEWMHTSLPIKKKFNQTISTFQDHVYSVLGQKTRSAGGILASRLNNQCRCLLRHT